MILTYIVTWNGRPVYSMGRVITIQSSEEDEAKRLLGTLGLNEDCLLVRCTLMTPFSSANALIQFNNMHPLLVWNLFKMSPLEDAYGFDGWYEMNGVTYYAASELGDRYKIEVVVVDNMISLPLKK